MKNYNNFLQECLIATALFVLIPLTTYLGCKLFSTPETKVMVFVLVNSILAVILFYIGYVFPFKIIAASFIAAGLNLFSYSTYYVSNYDYVVMKKLIWFELCFLIVSLLILFYGSYKLSQE